MLEVYTSPCIHPCVVYTWIPRSNSSYVGRAAVYYIECAWAAVVMEILSTEMAMFPQRMVCVQDRKSLTQLNMTACELCMEGAPPRTSKQQNSPPPETDKKGLCPRWGIFWALANEHGFLQLADFLVGNLPSFWDFHCVWKECGFTISNNNDYWRVVVVSVCDKEASRGHK